MELWAFRVLSCTTTYWKTSRGKLGLTLGWIQWDSEKYLAFNVVAQPGRANNGKCLLHL